MFREKEAVVASMRSTFGRAGGPRGISLAARVVVAAVLAGGVTVATAGIAAAQTGPGPIGTNALVVKEAFRTGFGKIVVVHGSGRALYTNPAGCSAACQSIWPPLLLARGRDHANRRAVPGYREARHETPGHLPQAAALHVRQ